MRAYQRTVMFLAALTMISNLARSAAALPGQGRFGHAQAGDEQTAPEAGSLPAGVKLIGDVSYGPDPLQKIDVYVPAKGQNVPAILMVHGGGWMLGTKKASGVVSNKVAYWVPKGCAFVSVGYRLSPQADPIEQAKDIAQALAFAQAKAQTWGIDPHRFILMGHSSGAHLVDLITAAPDLAVKQGAQPWLGTISLDSAAIDTVARMTAPHERFFDQVFGKDASYWQSASPMHRLQAKTPPMLLVCSTMRKDSCQQSEAFAERAKSFGSRVVVLPVALRHGEINQDLGLPGKYTSDVDEFVKSVTSP